MKIRLIHGIHSPEGDNNMSALLPHMQKAMPTANVQTWEYGFVSFIRARWTNSGTAERLAADFRIERDATSPEVWITHSNGAAVAYLAVKQFGAYPDMIINVNPALDRWRVAPVPFVETIHSAGDRWVWLSQHLPGHIWGDQGLHGIGSTPFRDVEGEGLSHFATGFTDSMAYVGHTGLFYPERINKWAYFMANRIEEVLLT